MRSGEAARRPVGGVAASTPVDAGDLASKLRWLIAIRMLVAVTISATYALLTLSAGPDPLSTPIQRLMAMVSVQTLVYIALLHGLGQRYVVAQAYLQFIGDLLLVTSFISLLDAVGQAFSILYLVVISVAAVLLRRGAGLVVAGLAFVFYSLPLLALRYDFGPLRWFAASSLSLSVPQLIYNLAVHLGGFYGVALLTAYLARDVTRAEMALLARDQDLAQLQGLHRDVIRSISSGLITTDLEGVVTSINRAGEQILGRAAESLVGRPIVSTGLYSEAEWRQRSADGARRLPGRRAELDVERGTERVPIGFSLTRLRGGDGTARGFIVNFQDLTEMRKLQDQVRIADRMAAVGEMAAGLAHEVGNPLAAISGSTQMLSASLEGDPSQRKLLEITLRESQRLDRTVKGFLQFARPRERRLVGFDVASLVAEQSELLKRSEEVRTDHAIVVDLEPPHARLVADPDQISQVFWNLVRNALKAMPEGGTLTIAGRIEAPRYLLRFRDTGNGMTEAERANLFHPFKSFFDKGVGIGMAIVYRIVEEHGGKLEVDSRPNHGTNIIVRLPARVETPTPMWAEA